MGILSSLVSGGLSSILGSVGDIAKVFVGSKEQRDAAIADEMKALQESYKAELMAPERIGWWASFVDGLNRLVRPFFTFGVIGLFVWAVSDTIAFTQAMVGLQAVPDNLWWLIYTIVGFWFGGRVIQDVGKGMKPVSPATISAIIATQKKLGELSNPSTGTLSSVTTETVKISTEPVTEVEPKPTKPIVTKPKIREDVRSKR